MTVSIHKLFQSLVPVLALEPKPHDVVLDMCAAPGGKTLHIAKYMQQKGVLIANEPSTARNVQLRKVLQRYLPSHTICITQLPGQSLWKRYTETFDKILVDAPCSMEGRGVVKSSREKKGLQKLQKYLVRSAFTCLKPGGTLIYSTCTLNIAENEDIVAWLKNTFPETCMQDTIYIPKLTELPTTHMRIEPSELWDGFFIAKIRKVAH